MSSSRTGRRVPARSQPRYTLVVARTAARQIVDGLPPVVAAAVMNFITGDLLAEPRSVGKPLRQELTGTFAARRGGYRVTYDVDDDNRTVIVLDVDAIGHQARLRKAIKEIQTGDAELLDRLSR